MKLKDQTTLITGASQGIGAAIARAFAEEGAHVAITGRSTSEMEALQKEFIGLGVRCEVIVADPTQAGAAGRSCFVHVTVWRNGCAVGEV